MTVARTARDRLLGRRIRGLVTVPLVPAHLAAPLVADGSSNHPSSTRLSAPSSVVAAQ